MVFFLSVGPTARDVENRDEHDGYRAGARGAWKRESESCWCAIDAVRVSHAATTLALDAWKGICCDYGFCWLPGLEKMCTCEVGDRCVFWNICLCFVIHCTSVTYESAMCILW